LVIAGLGLAFTLPFPGDTVEFSQFTFFYGLFLAPLVAAWATSKFIFDDPVQPLWVATRFPLWRIAIERNIQYWIFHLAVWTFFLIISWAVYGLRITESFQSDLTFSLIWKIWLSGTVSQLFFSNIGFVFGKPADAERGAVLAVILWLGFIVGGRYGTLTQWTPFGPFFDLQYIHWPLQQGCFVLLSLVLFGLGLVRISRLENTYGEDGRPVHMGREQSLFTGVLFVRLPGILRLVWMEMLMAVRRKTIWVYILLPFALLIALLTTGDEPLTSFVPLTLSNLLFVLMPLQAIYIAPALTRNDHALHDWFWSTPSLWTKAVAAQAVAYGLIVVALSIFFVPVALMIGVVEDRWTWSQMSQVVLPMWILSAIAILGQAFIVCALTFLLRRAIAVIALVSLTALGVYFSVVSPALTLLDVRDVTLASLTLNPITGIAPDFVLGIWLVLIYLTLGLFLWHTGLLTFPWREIRVTWIPSMYWRVGTAWILSLGMILIVLLGYTRQVSAFRVPGAVATQSDWWVVQDVSHVAQMGLDSLQVDSRLKMVLEEETDVDEVELLLNPGLQVQTARLEGQALRWSREGEVLHLALPTAVEGGRNADPLNIEITYSGWPKLLREDYARTNDSTFIGIKRVAGYTRETVSYADDTSLQWFRDSDWLIWPVTSQMHVASHSNQLEITVPVERYDTVVFPDKPDYVEGKIARYIWLSNPPSMLLLAGGYQEHKRREEQSVFIGEFQGEPDLAWADEILGVYAKLVAWWAGDGHPINLAYFPHGERIHMTQSWITVPSDTPYDFSEFEESKLNLAVLLVEDWLREQIVWNDTPVSTQGLLLSVSVSCDYVLEEHANHCAIDSTKIRKNPQVPFDRFIPIGYCLYPSSMQCGYIAPLRRALALALTYYAVADPGWLNGQEWQQWKRVADDASGLFMLGLAQFGEAFSPLHDSCAIAQNVMTIHTLVEQHGQDFLREWVEIMAEQYPIGSVKSVEGEMWNLATAITGEEPKFYESSCSNIIFKE